MSVEDAVSAVGLWWPSADEDELRAAAAAWDRTALALEQAADLGRSGVVRARARWEGEAAERFERAWARHEAALGDDVAGCRALASALERYADAVADATRRVEELAVTAGATIVAGVGFAWLTFGTSTAVAAGVSAGLVAAAEAIGLELSVTAATITGGALVGAVFGAGEAAVVNLAVTQPLRVEAFGDGAYSAAQMAEATATGAFFGGALGGALGRSVVTAGPTGRTAADDLRELDGIISAALDPASRGALGPLFRAGVHETPATPLAPHQRPVAHLLASEGESVHPRSGALGPGALVRADPADPGRLTQLARPEAATTAAVEDEILEAGGRLARHGGGDLVLDGRAVGLRVDTAGDGLSRAVERASAQGLALPTSIRFVFDGTSIYYP